MQASSLTTLLLAVIAGSVIAGLAGSNIAIGGAVGLALGAAVVGTRTSRGDESDR